MAAQESVESSIFWFLYQSAKAASGLHPSMDHVLQEAIIFTSKSASTLPVTTVTFGMFVIALFYLFRKIPRFKFSPKIQMGKLEPASGNVLRHQTEFQHLHRQMEVPSFSCEVRLLDAPLATIDRIRLVVTLGCLDDSVGYNKYNVVLRIFPCCNEHKNGTSSLACQCHKTHSICAFNGPVGVGEFKQLSVTSRVASARQSCAVKTVIVKVYRVLATQVERVSSTPSMFIFEPCKFERVGVARWCCSACILLTKAVGTLRAFHGTGMSAQVLLRRRSGTSLNALTYVPRFQRIRHIIVAGPRSAGKSSVVNALLSLTHDNFYEECPVFKGYLLSTGDGREAVTVENSQHALTADLSVVDTASPEATEIMNLVGAWIRGTKDAIMYGSRILPVAIVLVLNVSNVTDPPTSLKREHLESIHWIAAAEVFSQKKSPRWGLLLTGLDELRPDITIEIAGILETIARKTGICAVAAADFSLRKDVATEFRLLQFIATLLHD